MANASLIVDRNSPLITERAIYHMTSVIGDLVEDVTLVVRDGLRRRRVEKVLSTLDARTLRDVMQEQ